MAPDVLTLLETPPGFRAVGQSYEVFDQVSDEEVRDVLVAGES